MRKKVVDISKRIFEIQLLAEGAAVGALTGIIVSVFRCLLDYSDQIRFALYTDYASMRPEVMIGWFVLLFCIAWLLQRMNQIDPDISGSGIPQVKGILRGWLKIRWLRVLFLKLLGAVLGIGAGLSLGRQGPSVQFGACIGQGISHLRRRIRRREEKCLIISGAGAGLAAAFNAPLAGVVFCIEELSYHISSFQILAGIIAAMTATAVSQAFFGIGPIFELGSLPHVEIGTQYLCFILLGIFCGFLGMLFNRGLLFSMDVYERMQLRGMRRYLFPLLLAGGLGFVLPDILGGGNLLVDRILNFEYEIKFLALLFLGKFFFTLLCFGSGSPGGIFLPMMALGAVSGAIFGKTAVFFGWMEPSYMQCCIVFGMAALFSGAVKSPVSSSILIMELTGSFDHLLILLCISLSACMVLDMTKFTPIYDAILQRNRRLQIKNAHLRDKA